MVFQYAEKDRLACFSTRAFLPSLGTPLRSGSVSIYTYNGHKHKAADSDLVELFFKCYGLCRYS